MTQEELEVQECVRLISEGIDIDKAVDTTITSDAIDVNSFRILLKEVYGGESED